MIKKGSEAQEHFAATWRKTFMDICVTGMKRWSRMSGPGWRNKMWSLFNGGLEKVVH